MMINIEIEELVLKIKAKRKYHQAQYKGYEGELIMTGSAKVRINAAKSRERVTTYDELLVLIEFGINKRKEDD